MFSLRVCFKSLICSVSLTFTMDIRLSSCQYIKVVPFLGCDLNSGLTPQRALSSLGSCPSHSYHPGANVTVFFFMAPFFRQRRQQQILWMHKEQLPTLQLLLRF